MAAGKAVIAPRIGGCPEVVDEGVTGYLFESRNVDQLAECMKRIVSEQRHVDFGKAGRQRVERLFSRRSWVDGDEQVYLQQYAQQA
jgi:glycosyltransferase involved in cell wall biosynthesis